MRAAKPSYISVGVLLYLIAAVPPAQSAPREPPSRETTVSNTVEYQFVGFTAHVDDGLWEYAGLSGVAAMNAACSDDFGAGARAATLSEAKRISLAVKAGIGNGENGWIAPGNSPIEVYEIQAGKFQAFDTSYAQPVGPIIAGAVHGEVLARAFCGAYHGGVQGFGPALLSDGSLFLLPCLNSHSAACSAPVSVPVQ